jgi:hypothetical protein
MGEPVSLSLYRVIQRRRLARPMMSTKKKLPAYEKGSGNIFADVGLPNAGEHLLKAALVVQLKRLLLGLRKPAAGAVRRPRRGSRSC